MKRTMNITAAVIAVAMCCQLTACGLSGISEIVGSLEQSNGTEQNDDSFDKEALNKEFSEKLEQGKEILSSSSEGINAFKETAEDINELADQATDFVSQMAEDMDAKELIEELGKTTGMGKEKGTDDSAAENSTSGGILKSTADINLTSADGGTKNYTFTYNGEAFKAKYTADHWVVYDSYKINSKSDMMIICQALIDLHPVHGSDMVSYRTAEDMTFEWQQHNLGYMFLGEKSEWASHLKDCDFDPSDQGKTFDEIYKDRTGKEFKFSDFMSD